MARKGHGMKILVALKEGKSYPPAQGKQKLCYFVLFKKRKAPDQKDISENGVKFGIARRDAETGRPNGK